MPLIARTLRINKGPNYYFYSHIKEIKKYILVNYDGELEDTSNSKMDLHDGMMACCDKGDQMLYSIVKAGDLVYYTDEQYGWLMSIPYTRDITYYCAEKSQYWIINKFSNGVRQVK